MADTGEENKKHDPALADVLQRPRGRPPAWVRPGACGGWRGGKDWDRKSFDPLAQQVNHGLSYVDAGPRYAGKVLGSIKDYARGVAFSIESGALEWVPAMPFFTARSDAVSAALVRYACANDPRAYRLYVRPLINGRLIDRALVRDYFARIEVALGCRLAWSAAIHCKPTVVEQDNRHFHAIIRGTTVEGQRLKIAREFRRHGFTVIGRQLLTEKAGLITPEQMARIDAIREQEAPTQERFELLLRAGWPWWKARAWIANFRGEQKDRQWWVHRQDPYPDLQI